MSASMFAALLWSMLAGPAHAACEVDVYTARFSADLRRRRDRAWIYVSDAADDAGAVVPCRQLHLPLDPHARVRAADVRIRRGDRRGVRLGDDRARVVGGPGGGAVLEVHAPELQPGEVLDLRLRWALAPERGVSWDPAAFGPTTGARLRLPRRAAVDPAWARPSRGPQSATASARSWLRSGQNGGSFSVPQAPAALAVDLRPDGAPATDAPPAGSVRWRLQVDLSAGEGAFLPWPAGVGARSCAATGEAVAVDEAHGCRIFASGAGSAAVEAELPLPVTFDHCAAAWPGALLPFWALHLQAGGLPLVSDASGDLVSPPGLAPAVRLGQEQGAAGLCRAWLRAVDGAPVLDRPEHLQHILARASLLASVPEPGLPLELKHLDTDDTPAAALAAAVLAWQQADLDVLATPDQRTFTPRPLIRVRRLGAASPWEAALLLTRRLRQLRLEAEPLLLRPGPARDPASPFGWEAAVVVVQRPEGPLVLDPSCAACAPGELHPRMWGATPLGAPGPLPSLALAPGRMELRVEGVGAARMVEVTLEGPAAVLLRERLGAVPPSARQATLELAVGGLKLRAHEGIDRRGAPILLRFSAPDTGQAMELPLLDADAVWPGPRSWAWVRADGTAERLRWEPASAEDPAPVAALRAQWSAAQAP